MSTDSLLKRTHLKTVHRTHEMKTALQMSESDKHRYRYYATFWV